MAVSLGFVLFSCHLYSSIASQSETETARSPDDSEILIKLVSNVFFLA